MEKFISFVAIVQKIAIPTVSVILLFQMQKELDTIAEEEKEKELFDKPEDKPPDKDGRSPDQTLQDKREPVFV